MSWKKRWPSASIDVGIEEFSNDDLLQGLINSGWLHEDEAAAISKRAGTVTPLKFLESPRPTEELEEAAGWITINRRDEALIHIERYLGRFWVGRLAQ